MISKYFRFLMDQKFRPIALVANTAVISGALISYFLIHSFNREKNHEPVWSDCTGILDLIRMIRLGGLTDFIEARRLQLKKDTFAVRLPPEFKKVIIICHPIDIRTVISKEHALNFSIAMPASYQGLHGIDLQLMATEKHKVWRKILSSIISPRALESYVPYLQDAFTRMWNEIKQTRSGDVVILRDHIRRAQLRVMAKLLFGFDFEGSDEEKQEFEDLDRDFELECAALFSPAIDRPDTVYGKGLAASVRIRQMLMRRFLTAREMRHNMKRREISKSLAPVSNAMDTIIDAIDDLDTKVRNEQSLFTTDDISNNLLLLLEAAHGTTMYATTSLFGELLSKDNVSCLNRVRYECLGIEKWDVAASVTRMPFTDACINEILRLYPFAGGIPIRLDQDKEIYLPQSKVVLRGPTEAILSFADKFTDEGSYPLPLKFYPQRWLSTPEGGESVFAVDQATKEAFTPFGMGSHACLGQKLAMLTMRTSIYTFARCEDLKLTLEDDPVRREPDILPAFIIKNGVRTYVTNI